LVPLASTATAQGTVTMSLQPPASNIAINDTVDIAIQVAAGAQELNGASAYVNFPASILQVVDATPASPATISITNNQAFGNQLQNSANNTTGEINFSAGSLEPDGPFPTGTFTLATIRFRGIANGTAPVTFNFSGNRTTAATNRQAQSVLAPNGGTPATIVVGAGGPTVTPPITPANTVTVVNTATVVSTATSTATTVAQTSTATRTSTATGSPATATVTATNTTVPTAVPGTSPGRNFRVTNAPTGVTPTGGLPRTNAYRFDWDGPVGNAVQTLTRFTASGQTNITVAAGATTATDILPNTKEIACWLYTSRNAAGALLVQGTLYCSQPKDTSSPVTPAEAVPDFLVFQTTNANQVLMSGGLAPNATSAIVLAFGGTGIRVCFASSATSGVPVTCPNGITITFTAGTGFTAIDSNNTGSPHYYAAVQYNQALAPVGQSSAILTFPNSQSAVASLTPSLDGALAALFQIAGSFRGEPA
jgi:hypothetical protein